MIPTRVFAAAVLLCPLAASAADLERRPFELFDWRATARLAAMPICDVFRAGRFSDAKYRKYQHLEREILLAREAMNTRYGAASRFLEIVLPGDFLRPCR